VPALRLACAMTVPTPGWLVVVRAWAKPDEHYFAMVADKVQAEDQVRHAAQVAGQGSVEAIRALTAEEAARHGLQPDKIIFAPKSMH
jgi:hypothetical protein